MITTLVVLGATGDLTGRLLLPAVAGLFASHQLPADFRLIGAGHQDWTTAEFRAHADQRLSQHAATVAEPARHELLERLDYAPVDVTDPASLVRLLATAGAGPIAIYLALPTQLLAVTAAGLASLTLPPGSRIAVEKPFGTDLASAVALNATLSAAGDDRGVFRVDHVLAMDAVQALRRDIAGVLGDRAWGAVEVAAVDVLWEETLALEGRAVFFDQAGALRDVMQNHLLQILCLLAMTEADGNPGGRLALLQAITPMAEVDAQTATRRARYTAGRLATTGGADGRPVPDYADEPDVDAARNTETWGEVVLAVDSQQWAGVPFTLRAGKALNQLRRGVLVRFSDGAEHWFNVDDDGPAGSAEAAAYTRVLTELLTGGDTLSVHAAEAELAWQIFQPVLDAWAAGRVPLESYPAGSAVPRR